MVNYKLLKRFYNIHKNETLILICNGPSLNKINFDICRNQIIMGLNKIFLGFNKFNIYPNYYLATNKHVIKNSFREINNLNCIKFTPTQSQYIVRDGPFNYFLRISKKENFFFDISNGVNEGYTVTYVGLQIAYFMGFSKVILIGLDHKYSFGGNPNQEVFLNDDDPNHFDPSYFKNQTMNNPDLINSEKYYKIANEVFKKDNRQIIDSTINGNCNIFTKLTLEEVIN